MNMGDAIMMLGRGRCGEDDAENNRGCKRNFCFAQLLCLLVELRGLRARICTRAEWALSIGGVVVV
jgi:hypothetical protein